MSKAVDPLSVPLDTVIKQKAKEKKAEKVKQTKAKAKNVGHKQGKRSTQNKKSKPTDNNNNRKNNVDNLRKKKVKGGGGGKTPNAGAKQNNVPISKGKAFKKGQQKLARRQGGNTNNKGGGENRHGSKVSMQNDNNAKRKQQPPRRRRQHIIPPAPRDRSKDEALRVTVQRDEPEPELSRAPDTRKRKHVDIVEETDYSKEDIDLDRPPRAKRVATSADSREIAAEEDNFDAEEQLIVEELTQRFHRLQEVRAAKQRKVLSAVATRKFIDALAEETQQVKDVRRVVAPATNRTVASSSERERRFLLATPLLK